MRAKHVLPTCVLGALLLSHGGPIAAQEPPGGEDLVGTWKAELEHNSQTSELVVRFEMKEEGTVQASLSLPSLGAWEIASMPAKPVDGGVEIGSWVLTLEPDGGLSGILPEGLVPVHRIPFTLYPSERPERRKVEKMDGAIAEPVWSRDFGSPIWAGLTLGRNLLFVGDDSGRLSALDPGTGATRWEMQTGGAIRARPSLTPEALLVHSDDGFLYALDPLDGRRIWRSPVAPKNVSRIPIGAEGARYNHYASSALAAGDTVYVGGFDGRLRALDAATGVERWSFAAVDTIAGTPALADGRLFFGSFDHHVYALDASDGSELWRFDTSRPVVSSPLVHDGRVIIGSRSYDLFALDAATGTLDWKYYHWFSWVESSAVEYDGQAYVGSSDGQLVVALDASSGTESWRFDTGGSPWSQPAVTEEAVFIGTVGVADYMVAHESAFFALDRQTGTPLWHAPVERPGSAAHWGIGASPAVGETLVFVGGLDGIVHAYRQRPDDDTGESSD